MSKNFADRICVHGGTVAVVSSIYIALIAQLCPPALETEHLRFAVNLLVVGLAVLAYGFRDVLMFRHR